MGGDLIGDNYFCRQKRLTSIETTDGSSGYVVASMTLDRSERDIRRA
jgi:hypothetical protein